MYSFDVHKLLLRLSPWFWRKSVFSSWLKVPAVGLQFTQGLFYLFVSEKQYEMLFNAQVIYLEHILNDQFDNISRNIFITLNFLVPDYLRNDIEAKPPVYYRNLVEAEPPVYFRNDVEEELAVKYIVSATNNTAADETAMRSLINNYNLAGTQYDFDFT